MNLNLNSFKIGDRFEMNSPLSANKSRSLLLNKRIATTPINRKSSRFSISGKSTQSAAVVLTSPHHYVEHYGQPLPVQVKEALTFSDKTNALSVRLSDNGYAWLVTGRRLLIWKFQPMPATIKKPITTQCYELQLLQSDLAHRADLVYVFQPENTTNSHILSCIAVSAEGQVRYWPSINHDDVSIEINIDLQGQECDSLSFIGSLGFILVTTTCTSCILLPICEHGKHTIKAQILKTSVGWFGGIGKLVTSLISTNAHPDHSNEIKLIRTAGRKIEENVWNVLVLTGHSLQKWQIQSQKIEKLIYDMPLQRIVLDNFYYAIWNNCNVNISECETWILDIFEENDSDLILLVAAVNVHISSQLHYGILSIHIREFEQTIQTNSFHLLKIFNFFTERDQKLSSGANVSTNVNASATTNGGSLSFRFLKTSTHYFVFNQKKIMIFKSADNLEIDNLDFESMNNDEILSGSIYRDNAIFFSKNHGVLIVSNFDLDDPNDMNLSYAETKKNDFDGEVILVENMYINEMDPDVIRTDNNPVNQLKASFIYYLRGQVAQCNDILNELFPSMFVFSVDSILDTSVIEISKQILNDIPAGDPRWSSERLTPGIGSSMAMQITDHITDKQTMHRLLISFLKQRDLWSKLSTITVRSIQMSTVYILCEHFEKLAAAKTLKHLQSQPEFGPLLDSVIKINHATNVHVMHDNLSHNDLFYSSIGNIENGLKALVKHCDQSLHKDASIGELISLISKTSVILVTVLKDILQERKNWFKMLINPKSILEVSDGYLPWTHVSNEDGIKEYILKQYDIILNYGLKFATNGEEKNQFYNNLMRLIDIILEGEKTYYSSTLPIKNLNSENILRQFENNRYNLINSLVNHQQYEKASILAERYQDFNILIEICEKIDNRSRLNDYMEKFKNEGFSKAVFNWYLKENKQEKLISQCQAISSISKDNKHELLECLAEHPSLSWVQYVYEEKYLEAASDLCKIAVREVSDLKKRKNLFSIAKLCTLVVEDGNPDCVNDKDYLEKDIEMNLNLIEYQEDLPSDLLTKFGHNSARRPYLNVNETINMFICRENENGNEYDFKKALDLVDSIADENERSETAIKIWCMTLLRDEWDHEDLHDPVDILQQKLFFKLVDLCIILGNEPIEFLPQLDILLEGSSELDQLKNNKNFQYLMKSGYEYIYDKVRL